MSAHLLRMVVQDIIDTQAVPTLFRSTRHGSFFDIELRFRRYLNSPREVVRQFAWVDEDDRNDALQRLQEFDKDKTMSIT